MASLPENKEFEALVSLLDEPDAIVYEQIMEKVVSLGKDVIPYLEKSWENNFDETLQNRIEDIIKQIQHNTLFSDFQTWKENPENNLLQAYLLITRFQYPHLDEFDITRQLGRITQDVWLELNDNLTAFEKIKVFNKIFYDFHHFSGNLENLLTPDSLYLNRLLETRKGNPLSLGILYSIIARSLKIPVYGVMLPEHFILACAKGEITSRMMEEGSGEILFYINPFNRGEMFTRNEVNTYLKQLDIVPKRKYFYPSNDLQIVKIMIQSLIASYIQLEAPDKVEELEDLQKILD